MSSMSATPPLAPWLDRQLRTLLAGTVEEPLRRQIAIAGDRRRFADHRLGECGCRLLDSLHVTERHADRGADLVQFAFGHA